MLCYFNTIRLCKTFNYGKIRHLNYDVKLHVSNATNIAFLLIGIFESPKYDVNPQPNTRGIGPLVGRTSGNRLSVMHVFAVILSIISPLFVNIFSFGLHGLVEKYVLF